MGRSSNAKNKNKKSFNRAGGKHNYKLKLNQKKAIYRQTQKIEQYQQQKVRVPPYQIVHRQVVVDGRIATKFFVRRIPLHIDRKARTLKFANTPLKLHFKRPDPDQLSGNRIINLDNLKHHVVDITLHTALCLKAQELARKGVSCLVLTSEKKRNGMYSIMSAVCKGCNQKFEFETTPMNNCNKMPDINLRAVWGTISTGGGCSSLNELSGTLNLPGINQGNFSQIEQSIGKWWEGVFKDEIIKAGNEERRKAIERGEFHDGVPAITVICDGGWSKRTHKHSYNASGGVGVIFGAQTKKLLFMGVRNKYCYLCASGKADKDHACFKNWTESSQSMESDMILEGFLEAESVHGLRYMKLIADGDSSTYSKLVENVPVWGPYIKKLECANHACKCLRANLEKLVQEKPEYKGKGKLTKQVRVRLTTAVRCAIRMRSEKKDHKQLKKDIKNSIYHIFGFHDNCSDFCKKKTTKDVINNEVDDDKESNDCDDLFEDQSNFWNFGTENDLNESRLAGHKTSENVKNIIKDVSVFLNRLADKSERLIGNFTTNLAESWMNIRCKFDGGKVINRCNRGSWQTRCIGGALRKNLGPAWSPITYQKVTGENPGIFFLDTFRKKSRHLVTSLNTQKKEKAKIQRRKRKQKATSAPTKKAKLDYGTSVLNDSSDVSSEKLNSLKVKFLDKVVIKTSEKIKEIEKNTKDQQMSQQWIRERKIRLTSSNFGKVCKRKVTNASTQLVKSLLYSNFKGNMYTIRGLAQEANTIIEYQNTQTSVKNVEKMGLMISSEKPFLAASTDGKVTLHNGEVGLIEIKNLLQNNRLTFQQACTQKANFCLNIDKYGKMHLKKDHDYYYQCQGQMNIFDLPWIDFVVRRTEPYEIHIERLERDDKFWNSVVPKLEAFYKKFILPELALPRFGTVTGIRQPECPWYDKQTSKRKSTCRAPTSLNLQEHTLKSTEQSHRNKERHETTCNTDNCKSDKRKGTEKSHQGIDQSDKCDSRLDAKSNINSPKPGPSKGTDNLQENKDKSSKSTVQASSTIDSTKPGTSKETDNPQQTVCSRRKRRVIQKFVGRRISHEWCMDDTSKTTQWFKGTVLDIKKGRDGSPTAVYEVLYDGEDGSFDVENLTEDFESGSLLFIDL